MHKLDLYISDSSEDSNNDIIDGSNNYIIDNELTMEWLHKIEHNPDITGIVNLNTDNNVIKLSHKKYCNNKKDQEFFIVFIINKRHVRWHTMNNSCTIRDIYNDLKHEYNIKKCMLDIEDQTFIRPSNIYIRKILSDGYNRMGCNIHVTTKCII